jgi:ABC-type multidrug transport system fused ATPase/permease subunit
MVILIPLVCAMCIDLVTKTLPAIKNTAKIIRLTKSPIINSITESFSGSTIIRVYNQEDRFIKTTNMYLNQNIQAVIMNYGVNSYFDLRVDFLSLLLMGLISAACVFLRSDISVEE